MVAAETWTPCYLRTAVILEILFFAYVFLDRLSSFGFSSLTLGVAIDFACYSCARNHSVKCFLDNKRRKRAPRKAVAILSSWMSESNFFTV